MALGSGLALMAAAPAAFADSVTRYTFTGELSANGWPHLAGGVLTGTADWNPARQQWTYWDLNVANPSYGQANDQRPALLTRLSSNSLDLSQFVFEAADGGMTLGSNRDLSRSADAFCFQSSLGGGAGLSGQVIQGRGGVCDGTNAQVEASTDPQSRFLEVLQYFDVPAGAEDPDTGNPYWLRVRYHARLQFTQDPGTGLFSFAASGADPNAAAGNGISFQFNGFKQSFASPVACSGIPPEPNYYAAEQPNPDLGQGNSACPFALADSYDPSNGQDPTIVAFQSSTLQVTSVSTETVSAQQGRYADQAPSPLPWPVPPWPWPGRAGSAAASWAVHQPKGRQPL